jgi:hypothetical protein
MMTVMMKIIDVETMIVMMNIEEVIEKEVIEVMMRRAIILEENLPLLLHLLRLLRLLDHLHLLILRLQVIENHLNHQLLL